MARYFDDEVGKRSSRLTQKSKKKEEEKFRQRQEKDAQAKKKAEEKKVQAEKNKKIRAKRRKKAKRILIPVCIVVAAVAVIYAGGCYYFQDHFMPGTNIEGIDCAYLTVDEAAAKLQSTVSTYTLTLEEANDATETIEGSQINMQISIDNGLDQEMKNQNTTTWFMGYIQPITLETVEVATYDEDELKAVLKTLNCTDTTQMVEPKDTELAYADGAFYLEEAVPGTVLIDDVFYDAVKSAVDSMQPTVNLTETGCYTQPTYTSDSPEAQALLESAKSYDGVTIDYEFGSNHEVVDGETLRDWFVVGDDMSLTIDEEKEEQFVADMADKYDNFDKTVYFQSSSGGTASVETNNGYGWEIDQDATLEKMESLLDARESYSGLAEFTHMARSFDGQLWGDTYVEVNITAQHIWYYKDGELIIDSAMVSGCTGNNTGTHLGLYNIQGKAENAILVGQGYQSPVNYWMPFHSGEGLHDAPWRSVFGGQIYKYSGSHGCVNLPYATAQTIYQNIEVNCPIVVYTMDGTATTSTVSAYGGPVREITSDTTTVDTETATDEGDATTEEAAPAETPAETPADQTPAEDTTPVEPTPDPSTDTGGDTGGEVAPEGVTDDTGG